MNTKKKPQPRKSYDFSEMNVDDVKSVLITTVDPRAGARALCAAYAYGKRNGKSFCGAKRTTKGGREYMDIRRYA